jgi:hypothetical protein
MKNIFFGLAWLSLAIGIILTSVASYHFFYLTKKELKTTEQISEATPAATLAPNIEAIHETEDARAEIVANFLERHKSPLVPHDYYGQKLVEIADKYDMDFRLLPAIAMKESNVCRRIPQDSYNCLGWGITATSTLRFESYEDSFESAAKGLRLKYVETGRISTVEIGKMYNPNTPAEWASGVDQFMSEMRHDDRVLGRELKTEATATEFIKTDE